MMKENRRIKGEKTREALDKTDIALLVFSGDENIEWEKVAGNYKGKKYSHDCPS